MCLEACPTYRVTGLETESPRGRIRLMGALANGEVASTPGAAARIHLERCLACRACEAVCPSGVAYGRLIETTRAELERLDVQRSGRSRLRDLILRGVVSRPAVLRVVAAIASLYQRSGLRAVLRRSGLVRRLPPSLRRLEALYPPLWRPAYRRPAAPDRPRARAALLLGCVMRVAYGDVHTATARVLARHGVEMVDAPAQTCCGALHAHAGDREEARRLAERNIEAFEHAGVDVIVVDAAGCGAHMKHYAELFRDSDRATSAGDAHAAPSASEIGEWRGRAGAIAAKVRDVTEYVAALRSSDDGAPPSLGSLAMRVTYQDPCHLAHAQGIRSQPRQLLRGIEGLELVEMPGADICCGSAGFYNLVQPELADRLLAEKCDAVMATAPDAVVTANPGCMLQIEAGLRERGSSIPVLHVVELLERASARAG